MKLLTLAIVMAQFGVIDSALAQLPIGQSTQFDITGFVEEATLGAGTTGLNVGAGAGAHQGGIIKVNGHTVVVPSETVVVLPANQLTWDELFTKAPAPYTNLATGMAAADLPAPLTTYEAHVIGNRLCSGGTNAADPCAGATSDTYIAGLVTISQQALNSGSGFINFIDYATGELRVGGKLNDPTTGTRVRLNDPLGRYGRIASPDPRFTVDPDNTTVSSETGFPMCIPRSAAADSLCPQTQRPVLSAAGVSPVVYSTNFTMNAPGTATLNPAVQAPFEVGDYVTYNGTLVTDNAAAPTAMPATGWPGTALTYVSAHTLTNNAAIYTQAGTSPAYVKIDTSLIGTGGLIVLGAAEAVIRTRFEGMTTDPSRNIHLYGIDINPVTGQTADRDYGTIGVDQGAPTGAVKGRWRFRPPCAKFGSTVTDKQCVMNLAGTFLPVTREVRAVIEGQQSQATTPRATVANGLVDSQYHAPIGEYIFPENVPGAPIVGNIFNTIPFLTDGGYITTAGTLVGPLSPFPGPPVVKPAATCPFTDGSIVITSALYRQSKQRLIINASDANLPAPVLTLRPYTTTTGISFDPSAIGNEFILIGGVYTLDISGAPQPNSAGVQVQATPGGCSTFVPVTIRAN